MRLSTIVHLPREAEQLKKRCLLDQSEQGQAPWVAQDWAGEISYYDLGEALSVMRNNCLCDDSGFRFGRTDVEIPRAKGKTEPHLTVTSGCVSIWDYEVSVGTRDFQVFLIRYADKPNGKSMNMAICISEISDGDDRLLACECTAEWEKLEALFPNADIDFLKDWCEALRKEFCAPDTNPVVQERLEDCSSQIDVAVSRWTLRTTDNPDMEIRKLVRVHLLQ